MYTLVTLSYLIDQAVSEEMMFEYYGNVHVSDQN